MSRPKGTGYLYPYLSDDGCNIAVESFQTLCLFCVNHSCYIHPSEYPYMLPFLLRSVKSCITSKTYSCTDVQKS